MIYVAVAYSSMFKGLKKQPRKCERRRLSMMGEMDGMKEEGSFVKTVGSIA